MNNLEQLPETSNQEVFPALNESEVDIQPTEPTESTETTTEEQEEKKPVHPMELLLSEDTYRFRELEVGETIEGTIVSIRENEVLVDIGSKSEGVIPSRDLDRVDDEIREDLKVGDSIFIQVVRPVSRDGHALLSLSRALAEYDWQRAAELMESGEIFEGEVSGFNKGGIIVYIGKARGFVPASQLVSDEGKKRQDSDDRFAGLVGKKLQLKVVEIDRSRNRLILSERQAMRDWRRHQKERLLSELQVGDVRKGVISSLASFGAFVDLGGADGLIHLSELSWGRVQDPSEEVTVGDEVEVKVISVDRERRRIGLSRRQLLPEPWTVVHENYAIGQLVEAVITRLTSFGAFARVDGIIEGLVHISELSEQRINHPKEVVHEGQVLTLRIIKIDPDKRRMGLSLKRVAEEEYAVIDWAPDDSTESGGEDTAMAAAMVEAEAVAEAEAEAAIEEAIEIEEAVEAEEEVLAEAEAVAEVEAATGDIETALEIEEAVEAEEEVLAEAEAVAETEIEEALDVLEEVAEIEEIVEAEAVVEAEEEVAPDVVEAEAVIEAEEEAETDVAEETVEIEATVEAEATEDVVEVETEVVAET